MNTRKNILILISILLMAAVVLLAAIVGVLTARPLQEM